MRVSCVNSHAIKLICNISGGFFVSFAGTEWTLEISAAVSRGAKPAIGQCPWSPEIPQVRCLYHIWSQFSKTLCLLRVLKHSGTYSKQIIFQLPACSVEVTPPVVQQEFFIFFLERLVNTKACNCCGLGRSGLLSYFAKVHLCHLGK